MTVPFSVLSSDAQFIFFKESEVVNWFDTVELHPDPELDTIPSVFVNGSSSEFSYQHHESELKLSWSHTAGTPINFRDVPDSELPNTLDFILASQEINWTYEILPDDMNFSISFMTELSGDFANIAVAVQTFKVYVWLIDSSGNWLKVFETYPPYYSIKQVRNIDLSFFDIIDTFGGMVEDAEGFQEDPLDTFTVSIGLAPTYNFEYFTPLGISPIDEWTGSVTFTIDSISMVAYVYSEQEIEVYEPYRKTTWHHGIDTYFSDLALGSDGSLYMVGYIADYSTSSFKHLLIKRNRLGNLLWNKSLEGTTAEQMMGRGIAVTPSAVYTVGENGDDLVIVKWNFDGITNWIRKFNLGGYESAQSIAIDSNGFLYVGGISFIQEFQNGSLILEYNPFLNCYSPEGNQIWGTIINDTSSINGVKEVLVNSIGNIVTLTDESLSLWNNEGEMIWKRNIRAFDMDIDSQDRIYTVGITPLEQLYINRRFPNGTVDWQSTRKVVYSPGVAEYNLGVNVAIGPDDTAIVIMESLHFNIFKSMLKFASNGSKIWECNLALQDWAFSSGFMKQTSLSISSDGLIYLGGTGFGTVSTMNLNIYESINGFEYPNSVAPPDVATLISYIITLTSIGVIVIVGILIISHRRKGVM